MAIDAFACTTPLFLPEQFFVGRLEGWAVVESLVGGLLKRATIAAHGELDADTVVLTETYTFVTATATRCAGPFTSWARVNTPAMRIAWKAKPPASRPGAPSTGHTRATRPGRWQVVQVEFR
ncbi:DUF3833 family protein [Bradyrhizobium japonicum]|uniref:DUF3833 family protein n=1 Tax=Bradyrhizobium japonicum TaxID=375 RepID=UPI00040D31CD